VSTPLPLGERACACEHAEGPAHRVMAHLPLGGLTYARARAATHSMCPLCSFSEPERGHILTLAHTQCHTPRVRSSPLASRCASAVALTRTKWHSLRVHFAFRVDRRADTCLDTCCDAATAHAMCPLCFHSESGRALAHLPVRDCAAAHAVCPLRFRAESWRMLAHMQPHTPVSYMLSLHLLVRRRTR
jgi:hypothetical protein